MSEDFSASIHRVAKRGLIVCEGELDMDAAEELRRAADEALADEPLALHLDCRGVSFIDSIGLRALAHTEAICRDRGIPVSLAASEPMRRVIDALGGIPAISFAS